MKNLISSILLSFAITAMADEKPLEGFEYGTIQAPVGNEWESPTQLSYNKEQPRAYMFHFATTEEAKHVLPTASSYYLTLDGTWKFHWVASPEERPKDFFQTGYDVSLWDDILVPGCWNVQGLQSDGTMKYGVPIYVNQPVIFYHKIEEGDWKKGVMREPEDKRFTTYKYRNEVGSYRRTFTIPTRWEGRQIFINFDGVDSFFYLWINGQYVGFSKNSRNTAQFNITRFLNPEGENSVAVEVYRNSDGSFLEAQDMFRLPGIIRSTYLTTSPEVELRDMALRTVSYDKDGAQIAWDAQLRNFTKKEAKGYTVDYKIYSVELYQDDIEKQVAEGSFPLQTLGVQDNVSEMHQQISISGNVRQWSAEAPYRYIFVAEVKDRKGKTVDCISDFFGIRTVEISETSAQDDEFGLAGRYFYVNGKPVKLKGVNRHETNLHLGHAITQDQMRKEVFLMKRGNINHVRLSHYSNAPYWYYLADRYGLYLEDEANAESHEYYYGKESLSHPIEWRAAHVARSMELVRSHVNHPSIVIWSLGNEGGPGDNYLAAYQAIASFDKSRPVQYERNNDIVDMGSNQYPSVDWVRYAVQGGADIKYPFHISEYAHSMGNSAGNLVDYWEAMESTNFFCGAAIWDWVDQAIDTYLPDGTKYMGYGGDHGDWPNDGMFCMNGTMLPDLTPKPQYYEVKKVYQNVGVKMVDKEKGLIEIFNKNYFTNLEYDVVYKVQQEGRTLYEEPLEGVKGLSPRTTKQVQFSTRFSENPDWENVTVEVDFLQPKDCPWAKKGYVQMAEQFEYRRGKEATPYKTITEQQPKDVKLKIVKGGTEIDVQGADFHVCFDESNGYINTLVYGGETVIEAGNGPKLDAFRAPVDNDNWAWSQWFENGLYDLHHRTTSAPIVAEGQDGSVQLVFNVFSQATHHGLVHRRPGKAGAPIDSISQNGEMTEEDFHFTSTLRYTVYPDGSIALASQIVSSNAQVVLPRLGYALKMPTRYDRYTYYGRGPQNNYADRKTGAFFGLYESTVQEQFVHFPKPQSMGNREEVSWCALTTADGDGLEFIADYDTRMSTSALPWSALQMTLAAHPYQLPQSDGTYLHLDCQVTGLGGNSCGQGGPLSPDQVKGDTHQMKFLIRPLRKNQDMIQNARVRINSSYPITIVRDRSGNVSIEGDNDSHSAIFFTQDTKKKPIVQRYDGTPFELRKGGTITAWYEGEEGIASTATFQAIENIPVQIAYVSSEETPNDEVAQNLVDGDPATIWHTSYSITVTKYPHWVDFDCGENKVIKGFVYLPRQDGPNGRIKGYQLQVSADGKKWSEPVCTGEFANDKNEKKVLFDKPQKGRFLRFTALSSQAGGDFASGAEFTVLAE